MYFRTSIQTLPMKYLRFSLLLLGLSILLASCSTGQMGIQSMHNAGGTDEYAALEQPVPPAEEAIEDSEIATIPADQSKAKPWGKKAKGLFAGLALKKAAKKLVPKENLADNQSSKANVIQVLLIILLGLLILYLLRILFGFSLLNLLISLAMLVLLILLILYILGEL